MRNNLLPILAKVAVITAAAVWYSHRPTDRSVDTTVVCEVSAGHQSSCSCGKSFPIDVPTLSAATNPVELTSLKNGPFREQLEKLPRELQDRVLSRFEERPALLNDLDSLRVDPNGELFYACPGYEPMGTKAGASAARELAAMVSETGESVPISAPPLLHSRAGAEHVLFLDFNGHVVEGTAWNLRSCSSWDCRPYDTDGNESTFSASEQEDIIEIWERVAEDFAPFDIDITTEEPTEWDRFTGRVLITPWTDKNGKSCPHNLYGGMAYLDKFGLDSYSRYSPVWVADYEYSVAASFIAEAISHEFGHNLRLTHDGINGSGYCPGHENGAISWGPIMGTGYYRDVSQWSKGDYYNASNSEDDLSRIAKLLSYRADDYGDDAAHAAPLEVSSLGSVMQKGIIEQTDDPDVFYFSTDAGDVSIEAMPFRSASGTWGGNLDIRLELYDAFGTLVAESNPDSEAMAAVSTWVSSGAYYLHVKTSGAGDPMNSPPSGYTSYGSLGQYELSGRITADIDSDEMPDHWEVDYFGGISNAVAAVDSDGDGVNNLSEYISGHDPTNADSFFEMTGFETLNAGHTSFIVNWNAVSGRVYCVLWSHDLAGMPFTNISGVLPYPVSSFTDATERAELQNFYRVDVRLWK